MGAYNMNGSTPENPMAEASDTVDVLLKMCLIEAYLLKRDARRNAFPFFSFPFSFLFSFPSPSHSCGFLLLPFFFLPPIKILKVLCCYYCGVRVLFSFVYFFLIHPFWIWRLLTLHHSVLFNFTHFQSKSCTYAGLCWDTGLEGPSRLFSLTTMNWLTSKFADRELN